MRYISNKGSTSRIYTEVPQMNRKILDNPNVKEQTLQVLMKEDNPKDSKSMKMPSFSPGDARRHQHSAACRTSASASAAHHGLMRVNTQSKKLLAPDNKNKKTPINHVQLAKLLNRHFSKDIQMGNMHLKRCAIPGDTV